MWQKAWFRWSVRVLALVLLAVLATVFYLRSRGQRELDDARKEFTEKVGPLDLTAYESKPVPEEENGAVWLLAGARAVVVFQRERPDLGSLAGTPSSRWTQEQAEFAKRLLERNAPALTLLQRSLGMKACNLRDANSDGARIGLQLLTTERLLAANSRDALRQGDMNRFFASAEILGTLTSSQERELDLIELLLSSYAERLLLPVLQEAASVPSLRTSDIERLEGLVPTADLMKAMRRNAGYETAAMMDRISNGTVEQYLGVKFSLMERLAFWITEDSDTARGIRARVKQLESAGLPYARRGAPLSAHPSSFFRYWGAESDDPWRWDSQRKTAGRFQATMALRQMTLLGLQVRKAGLEKGAYPADLSAFPGAKIPDPFSGKPAAYVLHPDGSATLAIPDAEALYNKLTAGKLPAIGFTWTLPPVSREVDRRK